MFTGLVQAQHHGRGRSSVTSPPASCFKRVRPANDPQSPTRVLHSARLSPEEEKAKVKANARAAGGGGGGGGEEEGARRRALFIDE